MNCTVVCPNNAVVSPNNVWILGQKVCLMGLSRVFERGKFAEKSWEICRKEFLYEIKILYFANSKKR
jgi:hypothetical protein